MAEKEGLGMIKDLYQALVQERTELLNIIEGLVRLHCQPSSRANVECMGYESNRAAMKVLASYGMFVIEINKPHYVAGRFPTDDRETMDLIKSSGGL